MLVGRERRLVVVAKVLVVLHLLCLLPVTGGEWVDYPVSDGSRCYRMIPVEACEPGDASANKACMDVCHYEGCRNGGRCEFGGIEIGNVCRCNARRLRYC